MKPIFRTDLLMVVFTTIVVFTGLRIHFAGHFESHDEWHNWSVVHILATIALFVTAAIHIKQHWAFYKSLCKNRDFSRRSKITLLVTLSYLAVALSGIYLLVFVDGQGSSAGFAHYVIGIVFAILGLGHLAKRWKVFKKGVTK